MPAKTLLLLLIATVLSATTHAGEQKKTVVIATLFPQYDFARRIAGPHADVRLLLPPGAESHSYEPTPADMKTITNADLFIYTGEHMEPWAKRLADSVAGDGKLVVVDASHGITPHRNEEAEEEDHDHEHEHGDDHDHAVDPHIWLDPTLAARMAATIADALSRQDKNNAATYRENADALRKELLDLDAGFRKTVAESPRRELVFGDRFAFGYFFRRYGLEEVGAYKSCVPGAEPGLRAVINVVEYVKKNGVRFIYLEGMATGRISEVIRGETGVEVLRVDSLHTMPANRREVSFVDVMAENMVAFAKGLQ